MRILTRQATHTHIRTQIHTPMRAAQAAALTQLLSHTHKQHTHKYTNNTHIHTHTHTHTHSHSHSHSQTNTHTRIHAGDPRTQTPAHAPMQAAQAAVLARAMLAQGHRVIVSVGSAETQGQAQVGILCVCECVFVDEWIFVSSIVCAWARMWTSVDVCGCAS